MYLVYAAQRKRNLVNVGGAGVAPKPPDDRRGRTHLDTL